MGTTLKSISGEGCLLSYLCPFPRKCRKSKGARLAQAEKQPRRGPFPKNLDLKSESAMNRVFILGHDAFSNPSAYVLNY
jgi:hypothetical protein